LKPRGKKLAPFVPLLKDTMKAPAWRAMSHGAKMLYVSLKWHYNRNLGNSVFVSTRDAAEKLGSNIHSVRRWFRELQYYGFIVMVSPGCLGVEGRGKAPHWRLTEEWYQGQAPTRDFLQWDGTKFREQKSPKHYRIKKQNPEANSGSALGPIVAPLVPFRTPKPAPGEANSGSIQPQPGEANSGSITSSTTAVEDCSAFVKDFVADPQRFVKKWNTI
jgi:hypothetical protein